MSPPPPRSALSPDLQRHGHWNDLPADFTKPGQPSRKQRRPQRAIASVPAPLAAVPPYLPSPALTPSQSDSERVTNAGRPSSSRLTPCESGTEADDETPRFTHALPAPPLRPRKGLRSGDDDLRTTPSPGTTPVVDYFANGRPTSKSLLPQTKSAVNASWVTIWQRGRRVVEVCLLLSLGVLSIRTACTLSTTDLWARGEGTLLALFACSIVTVYTLYPIRLVHSGRQLGLSPSADPAPFLYPTLLPITVAVSLAFELPAALLPNAILSLASVPVQVIPAPENFPGPNVAHWIVSTLPLLLSRMGLVKLDALATAVWVSEQAAKPTALLDEQLVLLYPLHQLLLPPLRHLTSSSLLTSETQLLSVGLINVLLLAESPQMIIWKYITWIGAFGVLVLCSRILGWNVALERIPLWRFRRAGQVVQASRTFLSTLADGLQNEDPRTRADGNGSDGDQVPARKPSKRRSAASLRPDDRDIVSSAEAMPQEARTQTLTAQSKRKRAPSASKHAYLSMTSGQATLRKFLYAGYTYAVMVGLVLGPIRTLIQDRALAGAEPFGWAVGYLFGDLDFIRRKALEYNLENWVALSHNPLDYAASPYVDGLRYEVIGPANTRLLLFAYFAMILSAGIGLVLYLSTSVEVDTRRKVFHGTMVALLLPTAFIDPKFLSLGLILVLTVFLLLEVLRAAQIKPLSKPLARFLAPYVDGRDLRGPVVVSHIFLLIGCAIPFWLSLASIRQTRAHAPWQGWEAQTRDASMVAGVVCVGMGDAAASLIGRRYGRHKWPWRGGKSLEGSMAFAVAVGAGLVAAKVWLRMGGWRQTWDDDGTWRMVMGKALVAGGGAALSEAVLTGCNDNVVVPIILWLLVRGLKV